VVLSESVSSMKEDVGTGAGVPCPQHSPVSLSAVSPMAPSVPSLVVTAAATPCPGSPTGADSMLSEKALEAEPAQEVSMPTIPVAKNDLDSFEVNNAEIDDESKILFETMADQDSKTSFKYSK